MGLTGQYFHNPDFTGLAAERTEAVDFAWGAAAPAPGMHPESFSVRWIGQLEAAYSETYAIRTISDEGVRLWIGGQLVIDNWAPHLAVTNSASVTLEAGQRYDVRLEYYDTTGAAQIHLQWQSPSQPLQAIPAARLFASSPGLLGAYSDDAAGAAQRIDAAIDFNWDEGPPAPGIASDNFNAEWTGYVRADYSGQYLFSLETSDAVRLWVGDELIIDNFAEHPLTNSVGAKLLEAGKWTDIRLEYCDLAGAASVRLGWSNDQQTAGQIEAISTQHLRAAPSTSLYFTNPLGQGQDPWVIQWQGSYLHVRSSGNSVWIDQADQLQDIHSTDPASSSTRVWTAPSGTNYSRQIWAPELHQLGGKWYIYVAASDGDNATHRMHVLERDAANPMGAFTYKGQLAPTTDRWAIDGTVLDWQGQLYFIWSGWPGTTNVQQNLYIAAMSNPWTISGNRSLLATPEYGWEQHGLPINEGPQVLVHDGRLHIIYSGSGYWTQNYALARLTYDGSGSLLSAANWDKSPTPVFQKTAEVVGVGHASFTKSPDGTEDWIVYHAHPSPGGDPNQRVVRIQQFTFNDDGTPNFGAPLAPGASIAYPSGVPSPERSLVPGDFDASGDVDGADLGVFTAQFGEATFTGAASRGENFLTWQRAFGAPTAIQALTVNELPPGESQLETSTAVPAAIDAAIASWRHMTMIVAGSRSRTGAGIGKISRPETESRALNYGQDKFGTPPNQLAILTNDSTLRPSALRSKQPYLAADEDEPIPRTASAAAFVISSPAFWRAWLGDFQG